MSYYKQQPPVCVPPWQPPQGYAPQGYAPQGYPQQGYPPQYGQPPPQQQQQSCCRGCLRFLGSCLASFSCGIISNTVSNCIC